jgi:hypothetical protein
MIVSIMRLDVHDRHDHDDSLMIAAENVDWERSQAGPGSPIVIRAAARRSVARPGSTPAVPLELEESVNPPPAKGTR